MSAHLTTSVDVAIVGAGLSGLSAANTLQSYNLNAASPISYVVLEGNDRVGGKTHAIPALTGARTMTDTVGGVIDEGATFINDKYHTHMARFAHQYDFDIEVQYSKGDTIVQTSDQIFKGPVDTFGITDPAQVLNLLGFVTYIDSLAGTVDIRNSSQTPNATRLDSMTFMDLTKGYIGYNTLIGEVAGILTRAVLSRESEEISALFWLDYTKSNVNTTFLAGSGPDGAQYQRVRQGSGTFAVKLAQELQPGSIHLNTPVTHIAQDGCGYTISTGNGKTFKAQHVVFSIPSPLWKTVRFTPPLPLPKRELGDKAFLGRLTKGVAIYSELWWRNANLSGQISSTIGPTGTSLDTSVPPDDQYTLTCFIAGKPAVAFNKLPDAEQRRVFLEQIEQLFGLYTANHVNPEPVTVHFKDWDDDKWSRGAPTSMTPPGVLTSPAGASWRKKVGNISFIGTETAYEFKGYMEGAVRSGIRGANEAFEAMNIPVQVPVD